jgi:riboflavin kinase/FMN adenylyltransferase
MEAKEAKMSSLLVTFHPHPKSVVTPERQIAMITTIEQKLELFEASGLDACLILPFDQEFAQMSGETFIAEILLGQLQLQHLYVGFNFTFGRRGKCTIETLENFASQFDLTVLPGVRCENHLISSTNIRLLISTGNVEEVAHFLGRSHAVSGIVVHGQRLGRVLGFPTANLQLLHPELILPKSGVYLCTITGLHEELFGVVNIGLRPSVSQAGICTIEVHIIDFSGTLYGKTLTLHLKKRLRDEIQFDNFQELSETIGRDIEAAKRYFRRSQLG